MFCNTSGSCIYVDYKLLLPEMHDVLSSNYDAKFIGVHLMGSHSEYRRRYPVAFEKRNKPMTTASISHLLCTLTGTSYRAYDPTKDFISPAYVIRPRYVDDKVWTYVEYMCNMI